MLDTYVSRTRYRIHPQNEYMINCDFVDSLQAYPERPRLSLEALQSTKVHNRRALSTNESLYLTSGFIPDFSFIH